MHRRLHKGLSLLVILLSVSCASSRIPNKDQTASTADFDVFVRQTTKPAVFRTDRAVDVRFDVTVANRTAEPYEIERIALQSLGGASYYVPLMSREYSTTVAPGSERNFTFWTSTYITDRDANTPMILRTTIEAVSETDARREEVFTQPIEGKILIVADAQTNRRAFDPGRRAASFKWNYNLDVSAHDMSGGAYNLPW